MRRRVVPAARRGRRRRVFEFLVAEQDGAVLVLALTDPRAQLDEVFVRVDDRALDGLCRPRIVSAVVERHPTSAVLVTLPNLRPTHPTAHELFRTSRWNLAKPGFEPKTGGAPCVMSYIATMPVWGRSR